MPETVETVSVQAQAPKNHPETVFWVQVTITIANFDPTHNPVSDKKALV